MKQSEINRHLDINEDFQYSINIEYDLGDASKVRSFIPTASALEIIEDIMLSTAPSSHDRARILIGSYGKGKSHLILVILSLLMYKDNSMFDRLLMYIQEYNQELFQFIIDYIRSDKKLLPVIIPANSGSLSQSFLLAMQKTLELFDLNDLIPETHFAYVVETINNWKDNYKTTYQRFKNELNEPVSEFIDRLKSFDYSAYSMFEELYPSLTSGGEFNPFNVIDVIGLYEDVTKELKHKGYDGIYVIYDEFSKFLEADITKINSVDIRLLQDFAEKCNRSQEAQMHILLISHKDISNYIDKLPKRKVDGWRGVSERFTRIEIKNDFFQIYQIIATVIGQDKVYFDKFFEKYISEFDNMYITYQAGTVFSEMDEQQLKNIVYNCYPLHPVTTFILPRLSEQVAQNERTLFTFLSSKNKNTLFDVVSKTDKSLPIVTPDCLYDYFEPVIKNESYKSDIYKLWKISNNILRKLAQNKYNELGAKIIKTLAVIYIANQFEKLAPTPEVITDIFVSSGVSSFDVTHTISHLRDKEYVVYQFKSNKYLRLTDKFSSDTEKEIKRNIELLRPTLDIKTVLNKFNAHKYLYPVGYNDECEITRYFKFSFISDKELLEIDNWETKINDFDSTGVVYGVILESEDSRQKVIDKISEVTCDRVLFIITDIVLEIDKDCLEYEAIMNLRRENKDDDILEEELSLRIEDNELVLSDFVSIFLMPERRHAEYFYCGEKIQIFRKQQISELLTDICNRVYTLTPVIRNETINKNRLTKAAINAVSKIVDALLSTRLKSNLGLVGYGADVSAMRSTLLNTGLLKDINSNPKLIVNDNRDDLYQNVLSEINDFFRNADNAGFDLLYDTLTNPEHHIGLKKGVIPIFIAVILHSIKQYIVINKGDAEMELSSQLLIAINENPSDYTVTLENWDAEKESYIARLEQIFAEYIIIEEKEANNFMYIVRAMQRWLASLPKYSKEMKVLYSGDSIGIERIRFINALKKPEINAHRFLFNDIINVFGLVEFNGTVVDNIENTKRIFDNGIDDLINGLTHEIYGIFHKNQPNGVTLSSIMHDWYDDLTDEARNHLYNEGEDKILNIIAHSTNDNHTFIQRMAKGLTGLNVYDWSESKIHEFLQEIRNFKEVVEEQNIAEHNNLASSYKISFIDENGAEVSKSFEKCEYSNRASLLYNEITDAVDSMGQSISENEKRQVLMDILEELCR